MAAPDLIEIDGEDMERGAAGNQLNVLTYQIGRLERGEPTHNLTKNDIPAMRARIAEIEYQLGIDE